MTDTRFTLDLARRVALVTGGASGIGRTISRGLAQHGATVVVADLESTLREGGTPIVDEINAETPGSAHFVECDVTNRSQVDDAIAAAAEHGDLRVLVNNAGVFAESDSTDPSTDEFDRIMDINVKGLYVCAQAAARAMIDHGQGGSIINMSSVAGLRGMGGYTVYCGSKGAVRLMTYSMAEELGPHGIRVNAIHPGVIATSMTTDDVPLVGGESEEQFLQQIPLDRIGSPDDVAGAALFLASDLSAYVSGSSVVVDGGLSRI